MANPKTPADDQTDPAEAKKPDDETQTAAPPEGEPPIPSMMQDAEASSEDPDAEDGLAFEGDQDARVAELEAELADLKDKALRAMAEAENVRNRSQREVAAAGNRAIAKFVRELLPVADNLSRALQSVPEGAGEGDELVKNLVVGIEMTEKELQSALSRAGLQKLEPVGERFDSKLHEAMFEIPDPNQPAGTVGQVIEAGYVMGDFLVRPAKVGVTKGGPKPEAAAPPADGAAPDSQAQAKQNAYAQTGKGQGTNVDTEL